VHRDELAVLDELRIADRPMGLHVEQKPTFPEDIRHVDDAGRLLVLSQESRRAK
jgi:hypothetical protein